MDILHWIEKWYQSNCNSDWEHFYGIKIETIDNSGWKVDIDLNETPLEGKVFKKVYIDNGVDWIMCSVIDNIFVGAGDPFKLEEIFKIFKKWADSKNI